MTLDTTALPDVAFSSDSFVNNRVILLRLTKLYARFLPPCVPLGT